MNLNVNILLIILSYESFITCASKFDTSKTQLNQSNNGETTPKKVYKRYTLAYLTSPNRTDFHDCLLWVPSKDYNMPIPLLAKTPNPKIIYPNLNGILVLKQNEYLKLSCTGSHFVSPVYSRLINEITVKCLNKSFVEYKNEPHQFNTIACNDIPQSNLRTTNITCQNNTDNRILEVGFETRNKFIKLYRICFDTKYKNPLYAWYNLQSPYSKRRQMSRLRPTFAVTKSYINMNLNRMYTFQKHVITKILNSTELSDYYIRQYDGKHFLSRGHLMSRTEFNYAFQQQATFFYENTAPQWHIFNVGIWKDIEKLFKRKMAIGNSRHVVITGTYRQCTLPDRYEVEKPLFLGLPNLIAVPLFLWKLDYDLDKKIGVVFIGMNNPYKTNNHNAIFCKIVTCPGTLIQTTKVLLLFYCCSLESFEEAYGKLDPIVYETIEE